MEKIAYTHDNTPESPSQSIEQEADKTDKNIGRRGFLKLSALTTLASLGLSSPEASSAEKTETQSNPKEKEIEDSLMQKIGFNRDQIKPEYLKGFVDGKYKDLILIDIDSASLAVYDNKGNIVLDKVDISSGRKGMETPRSSFESGNIEADHINHDGDKMWYAIKIGKDPTKGYYIHYGKLTGYNASHGCVRLDKHDAESLFKLALQHEEGKKAKDFVIVIK